MAQEGVFEYDEATLEAIRKGKESKAEDEHEEDDLDIEDEGDLDEGDDQEDDGFTDIQRQAAEQGWRPLDEWDGEEDDWVDAKEFVYRGQLMDRISKQNKQLTNQEKEMGQMKKALKNLIEHNKKMRENDHKRLKEALKREKVTALEEGDHQAVMEIDDQIDELDTAQKAAIEAEEDDFIDDSEATEQVQYSDEDLALMRDWATKNDKWFNKDQAMTVVANSYGEAYLKKHPDDVEGMFKHVDKKIREEFPHKFKSARKGAAVTETSGRGKKKITQRKKKYSPSDMSEEQRDVARSFEKQGVMSQQEYVEQLALQGELPAQRGE